ncbi:MAG: hypothetical protein M1823_001644 [Watsoniomyces obsoletus]|nr:MAG: hypothetical protein M1823_001644 [Watsoniomyces obsoletus]
MIRTGYGTAQQRGPRGRAYLIQRSTNHLRGAWVFDARTKNHVGPGMDAPKNELRRTAFCRAQVGGPQVNTAVTSRSGDGLGRMRFAASVGESKGRASEFCRRSGERRRKRAAHCMACIMHSVE